MTSAIERVARSHAAAAREVLRRIENNEPLPGQEDYILTEPLAYQVGYLRATMAALATAIEDLLRENQE